MVGVVPDKPTLAPGAFGTTASSFDTAPGTSEGEVELELDSSRAGDSTGISTAGRTHIGFGNTASLRTNFTGGRSQSTGRRRGSEKTVILGCIGIDVNIFVELVRIT